MVLEKDAVTIFGISNFEVVSVPPSCYTIMASTAELQNFINRQRTLLAKEREAEIDRSSLLLSNCGPKILEQKGLSLGNLGVVSMHIGLGGKTYALNQSIKSTTQYIT